MHAIQHATVVPITGVRTVKQDRESTAAPVYSVTLGYLRAFITVLVLAHHAVLAYHPYAPAPSGSFNAQPLMWAVFPIVDASRWHGVALFVGFNDSFFMSLMFLLSGLFVWPSLVRKGPGRFLKDRFLRLGLPFAVSAALLAPLAYYPAYLVTGANPALTAFWKQWASLGSWPSGPAWFIWVLLVFGCLAAAAYCAVPQWGERLGRLAAIGNQRPFLLFLLILSASAAAYLPMAQKFDPVRWVSFGPFAFQASRLLHYGVYFVAGLGLGACGIERGLLEPHGKLVRRWFLWILSSPILFGMSVVAFLALLGAMAKGTLPEGLRAFVNFSFVLSCGASTFAFLSLFVRFAQTRFRILDSLSRNAYGMYLLHYLCVTWLQFGLLHASLPAPAKASIVFLGTLTLSWLATAALRRVPILARVL